MIRWMRILFLYPICLCCPELHGQEFPGEIENFPAWFVTGPDAAGDLGDDEHLQMIYMDVPVATDTFYVWVFDPEGSGELDLIRGAENSAFRFSINGGAQTHIEAYLHSLPPPFLLNRLPALKEKTLGPDGKSDGKWMVLGPVKPQDGAWYEDKKSFRFRFMAEGISGDDANVFRIAVSRKAGKIVPIEGVQLFAYRLSLVLPDPPSVSHLFPMIPKAAKKIVTGNFNWNSGGGMRIVTTARKGDVLTPSTPSAWAHDTVEIRHGEAGKPMDVQIIRSSATGRSPMSFCFGDETGKAIPVFFMEGRHEGGK